MGISVGEHLLGRFVNHDPRSRNFSYPTRKLLQPRSRMHEIRATALNQEDIGSCVGHTAAQWLNCTRAAKNRRRGFMPGRRMGVGFKPTTYLNDDDARQLYATATALDDFPGSWKPNDTGSSGLGGAKALQKFGFIERYYHVFDFPTLLQTIIEQPAMLGVNWYQGMFDPDKTGVIRPTGSACGGHEILIRGVDFTNKRFRLRNHWTPEWGINGDCFLSFADMERLLKEEGDVTVPGII